MCLQIHGVVAVATAARDHIALLGRCADAAGTAAERRRAAFRLALVILENEQIVGAEFNFRAEQRLIGRRAAPVAQTIRRALHHIVVSPNRLIAVTLGRAAQHIIREALAVVGVSTEHQIVGDQEEGQAHKHESNPSGKHLLLLLGCQF